MGGTVLEEETRGLTSAPVEDAPQDYGAASPPRGARGVEAADFAGPAEAEAEAEADGEGSDDPDPAAELEDPENAGEIAAAALTRRLRCLFHAITYPIVPLGALVVLSLLWMLYAAFVREARRACAHPLHWYAAASLLLLVYAPYHGTLRSRLFGYRRDRDGPARPAPVRRCDQAFHTVALLYVYAGMTLVQTCREDVPPEAGAAAAGANTCTATCPGLFRAVSVYVVSLEAFTLSLLLPLLFLPCLYLWLLRQATADGEVLALLQERLREEELLFHGGGDVTAEEVLAQLERVVLVRDPHHADRVLVLPRDATDLADAKDLHGGGECCICMNDFSIRPAIDLESGGAAAQQPADDDDEDEQEDALVRTHCGHIMHRHCMTSWIDGRWQGSGQTDDRNGDTLTRRARRTTCPLCRRDLRS